MVSGALIQQKINYGLGIVGNKLGFSYNWYRPGAAGVVIQDANLQGAIMAHITPTPNLQPGPVQTNKPDMYGAFDGTDVLPGDYLVGQGNTYFVGSFLPLTNVYHLFYCNEVFTLGRATEMAPGPGFFAGTEQANTIIASGFPGFLKIGDRRNPSLLHLPGEVNMATVSIQLPVSLASQIVRGDQLSTSDTIPIRWTVQSVDSSLNGWSIVAVEAGAVMPSDTGA